MNIQITSRLLIPAAISVLFACHSTKKTSQAATTANPPAATTPAPTGTVAAETSSTSALPVRNGIVPGDLELEAIQQKYPGTTAQNLANGHALYIGTCTDCHRKKNIFAYSESRWKEIIDDMAPRSRLNAQQTEDLYRYVLSMKATQNSYAK